MSSITSDTKQVDRSIDEIGRAATVAEARPPRARHERVWLVYLGFGIVAIGVHFLVPGRAQAFMYDATGLSSAIAIAWGIRRFRPVRAAGWWLLLAGQACFTAGDVAWNVFQDVFHIALPSPSLADAFYIVGYPLILAGLLTMARHPNERRSSGGLIDAGVVAAGCGWLVWVFAMDSQAGEALHSAAVFVSLAYPVMDIAVVGILALLLFAPGARTPSFRFLVGAMLALLAGDIMYAIVLANSGSLAGSPWSVGWLLSYVLTGTAALHPSMRSAFEHSGPRSERMTRGRLGLLAGIALTPGLLYAVMRLIGVSVDAGEIVAGSALLFGLVAVRMARLLRELEGANVRLDRLQEERGELLEGMVRASEDERSRLAAELHDGPVQNLSALVIMLDRALLLDGRGARDGARDLIERAKAGVSSEVAELRRAMVELRPPALDEQGLPAALHDLALRLRRQNIRCAVRSDLHDRPHPAVETILYRVAQEALANVAKHARAERATVALGRDNGCVLLEIADDGIGFDPDDSQGRGVGNHVGINGMRERVRTAGGQLVVESSSGQGTRLVVRIPIGGGAA